MQGLLFNNVQQIRGGIQNVISTEEYELFASQVAGEHTNAGDTSGLGGTDVGFSVTGADDGGLVGHTELLHNGQNLVGLGAAVLDFVTYILILMVAVVLVVEALSMWLRAAVR